jgi:hypothetical protein
VKQLFLLISLSVLFFSSQLSASVRDELSVKLIPDSLLLGANMIVRLSETTLTITSPSQAEYEVHDIVTILNESGAAELTQGYSYNQFSKITDFHINIYDKDGKLLNKHNLSDMKDFSLYDGFSLFNDARFKFLQTNGGQYPITIDRTVTRKYQGFMDMPNWYIQKPNQSVESTSLIVEVPVDLDIRFKSYNTTLSPSIKTDKVKTYTWVATGLKALKIPSESYGGGFTYPYVDLSPSKFEIAGYKGSLDSWSEFGTALATMWRGKRKLPDDVAGEIKKMVIGAHTDKEKIAILYNYLQKNFHYVSVQIGMGGMIPFDAITVHQAKYGDCKALSNYMCAILNVAGVRSYPVLINAGTNEHSIDTTFPSNHFNHAILYAEADGKPFWLECTSSSMPAGELGTFTESRYGLMIGDSTGTILATPPSDPDLNTITLSHDVNLTASGQAVISGTLSLSGEYRGMANAALKQGTDKEQATYIFTTLHVKQPQSFKLSAVDDSVSTISVSISGNSENLFDFKTGNKSFLPSSFLSSWYKNIAVDNDRKEDLLIDFPYCKNEKLLYHLDSNSIVSLPGDFELNNKLVSFHRKVEKATNNSVTISTQFKMNRHIIHPGEIALLKESLQKISKYVQQKVIVEAK